MKRKQQLRFYINWNEPMYDIRDRCNNNEVVESCADYSNALYKCDQANKGDF